MTAQDIIDQALLELGETSPGETPTTEERNDGLVKLNQLLQSWTAGLLGIYQITREILNLTGATSYTLPTRPTKIKAAAILVTTDVHLPLAILTPAEWAAFTDKVGTADFGEVLYYEDGYPLGRLHIAPLSSGTLELVSERPAGSGVLSLRETFTLTGAASYTIGVGGAFDSERPTRIAGASIKAGSTIAKDLDLVTAEDFAAFPKRGVGGKFAEVLYHDGGYPTATVHIAPAPAAGSVEIYSYRPLTTLATLGTTVDLPDGYDRALVFNLALDLAPQYGRNPDVVAGHAKQAREEIAGLNANILGPPIPASPPEAPPPVPAEQPAQT